MHLIYFILITKAQIHLFDKIILNNKCALCKFDTALNYKFNY